MNEDDTRKVQDEYDLIALIGRFMNDYDVPMDLKDAVKEVARECFSIGYELCKKDQKVKYEKSKSETVYLKRKCSIYPQKQKECVCGTFKNVKRS